MNRQKTEAKSPQSDNLQVIANELTAIRKLLFEQVRFQLGIEADTLKTLTSSREVPHATKQKK